MEISQSRFILPLSRYMRTPLQTTKNSRQGIFGYVKLSIRQFDVYLLVLAPLIYTLICQSRVANFGALCNDVDVTLVDAHAAA